MTLTLAKTRVAWEETPDSFLIPLKLDQDAAVDSIVSYNDENWTVVENTPTIMKIERN